MERFENTCDILAPVATCYAHWIQFEQFPNIMGQVKSVTPINGKQWRWVVHEPFGPELTCDTEIRSDDTTHTISWKTLSSSSADMKGTIRFDAINAERTRLYCVIDYQLPGEETQDTITEISNTTKQIVDRDLKSFKYWVENPENKANPKAPVEKENQADVVATEPILSNTMMAGLEDDLFSNEDTVIALDNDAADEVADDPTLRKLRREENPYLGLASQRLSDADNERDMRADDADDEQLDVFGESMDIDEEDLANFTEDLDDDLDGALPSGSRYAELSFDAAAESSRASSASQAQETANRPKTSRLAE